jgi:hypothetical protein
MMTHPTTAAERQQFETLAQAIHAATGVSRDLACELTANLTDAERQRLQCHLGNPHLVAQVAAEVKARRPKPQRPQSSEPPVPDPIATGDDADRTATNDDGGQQQGSGGQGEPGATGSASALPAPGVTDESDPTVTTDDTADQSAASSAQPVPDSTVTSDDARATIVTDDDATDGQAAPTEALAAPVAPKPDSQTGQPDSKPDSQPDKPGEAS